MTGGRPFDKLKGSYNEVYFSNTSDFKTHMANVKFTEASFGENIRVEVIRKGRDLPFVFRRFEGKANFKDQYFFEVHFFLLVTRLFNFNSLFHSELGSTPDVMSSVNSLRHE